MFSDSRWTHSRRSWSWSSLYWRHFTGRLRLSGRSGRLVLVSAPPSLISPLLQILQTLSNRRTAQLEEEERGEGSGCVMSQSELRGRGYRTYTHESSELRDEFVVRHADETVGRRDGSQLT